MARKIQNKDRIKTTKENLERLLTLLTLAENDEITLSKIGNEYGLRAQTLNTELATSFALYFKSRLHYLSDADVANIINKLETPSEKLLKQIFKYAEHERVIFPTYNDDTFWKIVKASISDKYYQVLTMHIGYGTEVMNFEEIGKQLDLTRSRVMQIYNAAVAKLRDTSVLTQIFCSDYIDETNKFESERATKKAERDAAYTEFTKLDMYLTELKDVKELNKYIETHYPNLTKANVKNAVTTYLNIPLKDLKLTNRTYNALINAGYNTIDDIYNASAADLTTIKNLGKTSLAELVSELDALKAKNPKWNDLREAILKLI